MTFYLWLYDLMEINWKNSTPMNETVWIHIVNADYSHKIKRRWTGTDR